MEVSHFTQKLSQYKDMVFRIAYTYLKNIPDAEDICQDTFLKLYQRTNPFPSAEAEKAWLIRVTLNACHNLHKSSWYSRRQDLAEFPNQIQLPPEESSVYQAVSALAERYRIVVLLYYYEEYSIQEIADLTGRKVSTIQTQLERARKKLKHNLETGGISHGQKDISKHDAAYADVKGV